MNQEATNHLLSLRIIASWQNLFGISPEGEFKASIPALQRGLVWRPRQNELLWDSILRGFPIGALVVSKWSERLKKTAEKQDEHFTHHLLDGQQRCYAIALGFSDPFTPEHQAMEGKKIDSILWLDLDPKFKGSSTRSYWVRATTTAHPWGYAKNDSATPLGIGSIRDALRLLGLDYTDPKYRRPFPIDLWPCKTAAEVPVPLSWLMRLPLDDEKAFWNVLGKRAAEANNHQWAEHVRDFCANPGKSEVKSRIFKGIIRAHAARLIALEAPDELLAESEDEKTIGIGRDKVTTNIEQLFQRLNQEGTPLDGEELAYCMIKAYWPDLEPEINRASEPRMPHARMVSLGVRAALATDAKDNLPGPPTVSALRSIAQSEKDKKQVIQNFINHDLCAACDLVDEWLKYVPGTNQSGLLPVHITSIAIGSREVYLLLLHFAKRMSGKRDPEGWKQAMQALATLIHWFAPEKAKVANRVYELCRKELSIMNISRALTDSVSEGQLYPMHSPEQIGRFIQFPEAAIKDWNWGNLIQGEGDLLKIAGRHRQWSGFLGPNWNRMPGLRWNRELLLYAQRSYMAERFSEYNPGRRDLWEDHNRPWDFDHILASVYLYWQQGNYKPVCDQWASTIGNLRAWPTEDNRSEQQQTALEKIGGDKQKQQDSFVEEGELSRFSGGDSGAWKIKDLELPARDYVEVCRKRLVRIYRVWYESVAISELVGPCDPAEEEIQNRENPRVPIIAGLAAKQE